jgi:hypothetical protein
MAKTHKTRSMPQPPGLRRPEHEQDVADSPLPDGPPLDMPVTRRPPEAAPALPVADAEEDAPIPDGEDGVETRRPPKPL